VGRGWADADFEEVENADQSKAPKKESSSFLQKITKKLLLISRLG
jgi:hypothetical protein